MTVKITLLSHACLLIETPDIKFATDPWIVGPAFASGWWNAKEPPVDWQKIINDVDFIYMSHNHNDHLNEFTLEQINKNMKFIVPDFKNKSVERPLNNLGFQNIAPIKPKDTYIEKDCSFNIYQSGDDRDDSGLLMNYKGFKFLTSVDSVNLNNGDLPKKVTVYASSFAGGSSGFPLMFERMEQTPIIPKSDVAYERIVRDNEQRKKAILFQNLQTLKADVKKTIYNTKAQFYLPYAGFYKVDNDYVTANDTLLEPKDYKYENIGLNADGDYEKERYEYYKYQLLDTSVYDNFEFNIASRINLNYHVKESTIQRKREKKVEIEKYKNLFKHQQKSLLVIEGYFLNSKFQHNLILYLNLCRQNNEFETPLYYHIIDFSGKNPTFETHIRSGVANYDIIMSKVIEENKNIRKFNLENEEKKKEIHILKLSIKLRSFLYVIKNKRPLEDIITGYQCVVDREPNNFKVDKDFWYHFTNVYTG